MVAFDGEYGYDDRPLRHRSSYRSGQGKHGNRNGRLGSAPRLGYSNDK